MTTSSGKSGTSRIEELEVLIRGTSFKCVVCGTAIFEFEPADFRSDVIGLYHRDCLNREINGR